MVFSPSVRPSVHLSVCLSVCLSACLSFCLSVCLSACREPHTCEAFRRFVALCSRGDRVRAWTVGPHECLSLFRFVCVCPSVFICLVVCPQPDLPAGCRLAGLPPSFVCLPSPRVGRFPPQPSFSFPVLGSAVFLPSPRAGCRQPLLVACIRAGSATRAPALQFLPAQAPEAHEITPTSLRRPSSSLRLDGHNTNN